RGRATGPASPRTRSAAVAEHVIVVSIDGLRPDAIGEYGAATIRRLMRQGGHSLGARTILPSKTLPSHTSMLTGLEPEEHGIGWNSRRTDEHGVVGVPTIFELAKRRGLTTAGFFSKAKFHHLVRPGSLDYWQAPSSNLEHWMAPWTVAAAAGHLRHERPNLAFVHIGEPDYAGHALGWMGWLYGLAVKRADAAVAELVEAADDAYGRGNYTLILTSDHGGHDRDHGSDDPRDMTIPWLVWGQGVEAGGTLPDGIRIMDTAATALWLLGIDVPDAWAGFPVAVAFTREARAVADAAQTGRRDGRFSAVAQQR
ncbi:MAG: alkaline phosphatase family protein, partial [Gemmatimonadota bacterium]